MIFLNDTESQDLFFSGATRKDICIYIFSEASNVRMDAKNGFSIKFYIDLDIQKYFQKYFSDEFFWKSKKYFENFNILY